MKTFEVISLHTRQMAVYDKIKMKYCREYGLASTAFDIIMFLHNNPQYNTAQEICTLRGIKSGIVSVEVEKLVQRGLMIRQTDQVDRRKQRLFLTEKADDITQTGFSMQQKFTEALNEGIIQDEILAYNQTLEKMLENIIHLEKEGLHFE
ncbi:MAG: MarR family winged helix-turn-helix transcriptional regulator [Eubacteriales bacterium]